MAGYLADAVDAPGVDGQRIDIGWDRPVSMEEIAQISEELLGQQIRVRTIPTGLINTAAAVVSRFSPMVKDMAAMVRWFQTGRYVADTARQRARGIRPGAYRGAGNLPACPQLRPHCQPVRSVAFGS
jgi:hypothetical protein